MKLPALIISQLAVVFAGNKKPPPPPPSIPVYLSPLVFLPFHLGNGLAITRVLPYKSVSVPLVMALVAVQYPFEHMPKMMASYGGLFDTVLGPLTGILTLVIVSFFYFAFKKGDKKYVFASLAAFIVQVIVLVGFVVGPPPDTLETATASTSDPQFLKWHLLGHALTLGEFVVAGMGVPWRETLKKD